MIHGYSIKYFEHPSKNAIINHLGLLTGSVVLLAPALSIFTLFLKSVTEFVPRQGPRLGEL